MLRGASACLQALVVATVGLLVGACGQGSSPESRAVSAPPQMASPGHVLRRGNGPDLDSLDPAMAMLLESGNILRDMYEGLVRFGPELQPLPGVAERWEVSADGRQYTFHLRPTARWSNGDPVSSQDFVASWRRVVDPKTGSPQAGSFELVVNAGAITAGKKPVESLGVSAPDPGTLVVKLVAPAPHFPLTVSHWALLPTPGGHPPSATGEVVSNGAFVLSRRIVGSDVELRRNKRYWNDAATRLDGVRYFQMSDNADEYRRFRAGELDVTMNVPLMPLDELRKAQGEALRISPNLAIYYYGFNTQRPPFDSRDLRVALNLAVDRDRLVRTVTAMGERAAYAWVPEGMPKHTPQTPAWAALPYTERVARARALYAKAGYSAAKPLRFELRYNTGTAHEKIALAVAAMWKEALGVEVTLASEEFKSLLQTIQRGETQMFRSSWAADAPEAYGFLRQFSTGDAFNLTRYSNAAFDAEMRRAFNEPDPRTRAVLLESAERRVLEDAPVIPLYFMVNRRLVSPRVVGWKDNALRIVYSQDVSLKE